ncbi:MAG TPA: uroporphyrinogen decarboxylase family protein [Anaerolineae bacterium]
MTMTPRERILAALAHKPTDVVPFDIGGVKVTSLNRHAYAALTDHLGFGGQAQVAHWRSQRTHMTEELSRFFDGDVRRVHVPYADPLPEAVTRPVQYDEWGSEWTQSTDTGLYFVSRSPLAGDVTAADVRQHAWPEPSCLADVPAIAAAAARLRRETDCAICLDLPDGVTHLSQFLRGFDDWLVDVAANQALLALIMDHVTDIYTAMLGPLLDAVGDNVDIVLHCDDIAAQGGPLISPRAYRSLIKPRQRRIFDTIRAHSRARLLYHSCGSMFWALPDVIDLGVDALNPIQVSSSGMDTARLKAEFGRDIAFWGAVDTGYALPFGTPAEVRAEVQRRVTDLAGDGGYVIGSVHIIQQEVPPVNILAMAEAAHVYGGRSDGARFRETRPAAPERAR